MAPVGTLEGKVGLVTGGSQGAGLAIARSLARRGMAVGLLARSVERLEHAVDVLRRDGAQAVALPANVSSEAEVDRAVSMLARWCGRIDLLVNNAGVSGSGSVEHGPVALWRETVETNLIGPFLCARAVIPRLRAAGGGWIISIASGAGKQGYPNLSAYSASKFGLLGLSESLAKEVRADNIKVSTIVPGSILTDFGGRTREERLLRRANGDRFLEPEDVAQAVCFLLEQSERAWTQEMNLWPY